MYALTRKQFDILALLADEKSPLSQRQIEEKIGHSLGTMNRVMKELTELKYVNEGEITNEGLAALEPYRAKHAIFIAAGFGSRLVPITFNTPKPLVRVHGVRITCACSLVTMKCDGDGTLFLKGVAWFGVAISAVFMVLQLMPIPGLSGVHFCTESYILLLVWVALGAIFYMKQKKFFYDEK